MKELKEIEYYCYTYKLTDYVKTLSTEEIERYINLICCNDIVGIKVNIYEVLRLELEYRKNDLNIANKALKK